MKPLTLFVTLFFLLSSYAQEIITFERNKKTKHLFDESNPLSFISILQQNAQYLYYYNLVGMDSEIYDGLTQLEREKTFKFLGPQSDMALVNEFGEPLITTMADGTQYYTYPARDSLFIDLSKIDKIEFTLLEGKDEPIKRLDKLHLWKQYESGLHRVLTLDASVFMNFNGINLITPVNETQQNTLINESENATLWSTLRDSSIQQMQWFQDRLTNGVFQEEWGYAANYMLSFFPYSWSLNLRARPEPGESMYQYSHYSPTFDYANIFPFLCNLSDSVGGDFIDIENLKKKFDGVHYILKQSTYPLVDEYGDPIVVYDEYGNYSHVYPEPEKEYFFLDYDPTIFISKKVVCDSAMHCQLIPTSLLFCLNDGGAKPELISTMSLELEYDYARKDFLKPFVADFKSEELWSIPEFALLKSTINNKKFRKTQK